MQRGYVFLAVASCALATTVSAHDIWENPSVVQFVDDGAGTSNKLLPGVVQRHDLEGLGSAPDQDWIVMETKARRSYEVELRGGNVFWPTTIAACGACAKVERVDGAGTVLTEGVGVDGAQTFSNTAVHAVVRWTGTADQRDFIRVTGALVDFTANDVYDVVLRDTTLSVPRWNNTATQTTVFIISNQAAAAVTGSVFFYNAAGALLHTQALNIPRFGTMVLPTAGIPALAGASGAATVAHDGPWGALAGKAVALEPATGFTFDTQMTNLP